MRRFDVQVSAACAVMACAVWAQPVAAEDKPATPAWSFNATNIEACSCAMPCPCYWVGEPTHASHGEMGHEGYCYFNNAFRVNKGHWGDTPLDGVTFWMAGDVGDQFTKGKAKWMTFTFEPGTTPEQRAAIKHIVGLMFLGEALQWDSITEAPDAEIEWEVSANTAVARLDDGKAAEVVLKKSEGMGGKPIVLQNMKFWAAPRNDGFIMTGAKVQAYRLGDKPFETKDTNGFFVTIDMNSEDFEEE